MEILYGIYNPMAYIIVSYVSIGTKGCWGYPQQINYYGWRLGKCKSYRNTFSFQPATAEEDLLSQEAIVLKR